MSAPRFQRAAILGVGLIGGSVALGLRRKGLAARVVGVTRSAEKAEHLVRLGVVDEATAALDAGADGADLVVACTPVGSIAEGIVAAAGVAPGALLTDAGSTKAQIVEAVVGRLGPSARFVGTHPLAGGHRTGPEAARPDLCDGATTIVTPHDGADPEAVGAVCDLWRDLGCRVETMAPDAHDRLVAVTSHVPHIAAAAVAATTPEASLPFAATGWSGTTRVAAGSPALWRDILLTNRQAIADGVDALLDHLRAYREALAEADAERIEQLLDEGRRRRDALGD